VVYSKINSNIRIRKVLIMAYYFEVFEPLFKNNVKYLLVGGLAVGLYGIPRITQDMDIIISMEKENILKLNRILKELRYIPRLPVNPDDLGNKTILNEWITEKNLKVFNFYNKDKEYKRIDILIEHPLDFEKSYQNKITRKVKDIKIYLVSIDDLIKMKQLVGRNQDISDIALLNKVKKIEEEDNE